MAAPEKDHNMPGGALSEYVETFCA